MRNLAAILCLVLAVLFGNAGESFALPQCKGSYRHNCFGTFTWADGSKYVGEFRDNKRHGQGTLTYADGGYYIGEWRVDQFHGQAAQLIGLQAVSRTVVLACCSCPPIHSAQRRIQPLQRVECLLMAISGPSL